MDDRSFASQVQSFLSSPAGEYFKTILMARRESIISKGKKARNDVKKTEMWAELEAHDNCCAYIWNAENYQKQTEMEIED